MPKPRDYKREAALESPQRRRARAERKRARRAELAHLTGRYGAARAEEMLKGKDVDHKKPLAQGGSGALSNLRLRDPHANRADKGTIFRGRKTTRPKHPERE